METTLAACGLTAFWSGILAPLFLCSSLPLGMPPAPEDPALGRMAPRECVVWLTWAAAAKPDPNSKNSAEQYLADPEIERLQAQAARRFLSLVRAPLGERIAGAELGKAVSGDLGFWCGQVITRPGALYVSRLSNGADGRETAGGFILNVGPLRDRVAEMLQKEAQDAESDVRQEQVAGHTEYSVDGPVKFRWGLWGDFLILAWGDESPEQIANRGKGPKPDWLAAIDKDLPVQRRAAMLRVNLKPILAVLAADKDYKETVEGLRGIGLRSLTVVTGLEANGVISRTLVELDESIAKPLCRAANRPLCPADLAPISDDALLALAGRVDPQVMARFLPWLEKSLDSLGKSSSSDSGMYIDWKRLVLPERWAERLDLVAIEGQAERKSKAASLPLDEGLCREIAASLDDSWCLYTSLGEGSFLTATARIKDRAGLQATFDRLVASHAAGPKAAKTQDWAIGKSRFAGRDIYFLLREKDSAFTTAWCLTDTDLVWAMSPQCIKAYLLRDKKRPTLAQSPAVAEAVGSRQAPNVLFYENSPAFVRYAYPVVQHVVNAGAAQHNLLLDGPDPLSLPAASTIAKYMLPAASGIRVTPRGIEVTVRQSLPGGNLGATLWVALCALMPKSEKWWDAEPGKSTADSSPKWKEWQPAPLGQFEVVPPAAAPPPEPPALRRLVMLRGAEKGFVFTAAFSQNGKTLAYGGGDNNAILWDLSSRRRIATVKGHTSQVECLAFSPNGKMLATEGSDSIRLWDLAAGRNIAVLEKFGAMFKSVAFSPDGKTVASGDFDNTVILWDVATGKKLAEMKGEGVAIVFSVAFSPNGRTIAAGTGNGGDKLVCGITLWDALAYTKIATIKEYSGTVDNVAFSPDGKTLASCSNDSDDWTFRLWDLASRKDAWKEKVQGIRCVAFSPDGKTLAVGSASQVNLWDLQSRKIIATAGEGESDSPASLAFSPDGNILAEAGWNTVKLWEVKTDK